jgi:hypothetical protein
MTRGPRVSASAGGGRLRWAVRQRWAAREVGLGVRERGVESGGRERTSQELGRDANGLGRRPGRMVSFSFFSYFYFLLKQANTFEFKSGFESKHPTTMHRHECNTHTTIYLF